MTRRRSTELFPTDEIVDGERLIGRDDDIQTLVAQLRVGINLTLAGPRRTGKSSVAYAGIEQLCADGYYVVQVDLYALLGLSDLAKAIATSAVSNRPALKALPTRAKRAAKFVLTAGQLTLATKAAVELGVGLELALGLDGAPDEPYAALRASLELLEKIAAVDQRQLILFLDELQELAAPHGRFGDADAVTKLMVSVLKKSKHVTCLFAGSVEHLLRDLFINSNRGFYRFGEMTLLSKIWPDAWKAGIARLLDEDQTVISDDAFDLLMERTEGHPYAVMLTLQRAHTVAVEDDAFEITTTLCEVGWRQALRADSRTSAETLERVKVLGPHALTALVAIANNASPYRDLPSRQARRSLDLLIGAGLVEEGERGEWSIPDPLFRAYLAAI